MIYMVLFLLVALVLLCAAMLVVFREIRRLEADIAAVERRVRPF